MRAALRELLRNVLLVGAVFGAAALVLEIPALGEGVQRGAGTVLDWVALNRGPALLALAFGLAALITAARLDGKGGRA